MKLFGRPRARHASRPACSVEPLEIRRLLVADIGISYDVNGDGKFDAGDSIDVNGDGTISENEKFGRRDKSNDSRQIDIGTGVQNTAFRSNIFRITNEGDGTLSILSILESFGPGFFAVLRANGTPLYPGGNLQQVNLGAGQSLDIRFGVNTTENGDLRNNVFISSNDFDESSRRLTLRAQVSDSTPGNVNWGQLGGDKSQTFLVTGQSKSGAGFSLLNVTDQLIRFELGSGNHSLELSLGGVFRQDSAVRYGRPQAILTRDSNGDGKLSAAERDAAQTTLTATPPGTVKSNNLTLAGGKYLIYLTTIAGSSGAGSNTGQLMRLDSTVGVKLTTSSPAGIQVRGNDVIISDGDTTPSLTDGTSFGSLVEGSAPTLTFTVRNTGGSVLNITGQRPDITGDFIVVEELSSTIAAGGSDNFTVQLINTGAGAKQSTITIQTSAGAFTFRVGGTLTPAGNPGSFVTRNGDQLIVAGTPGNDRISINSTFDNLVIARNGVTSQAFSVSQIKGITVNCGDGNDSVSTTTNLRINMTLNGQRGDDLLRSGKGKDLLRGGDGKDRLDGAGNRDKLDGGGGSDYAYYSSRSLNLNISLDNVANDGEAGEKDLILFNVEHVQGGKGDDRITGNSGNNILRGGAGDDVLIGNDGNDELDGGPGTNNMSGGAGDDTFLAFNDERDTVNGGADDDTVTGDLIDLITSVETQTLS
jgi:RTX calcium-binding nonapeptide repeat (4 copies)